MNILKILIVDDTPHWSGSLVKRLTDPIKYKVDLRAEADGAVNLAKSDRFDVVFIDLDLSGPPNSNSKENEMPVLEGVDVCSHVRDLQKNALIVIYSGHIDPGAEDKFPHYERCNFCWSR